MQPFAMHALRSRPGFQRYFMWLLCLAFLLPIAQVAAAWHGLSHTGVEARVDTQEAADAKRSLPHPIHCDLCLTASAVSGGAPPSASQAFALLVGRQRAPQTVFADVVVAPPALAYRSRAPPSALL